MATFLAELRRRKIVQVTAVYAVVAWLLVQVVATVAGPLTLPTWTVPLVIVLLAIGLPVTLVISWAFDTTPSGLVRDRAEPGSRGDRGRTLEYTLIVLLAVAVSWLFYRDLGDTAPVSDATAGAGEDPAAPTVGASLPNSIAVLLCDNLSPDPDNAFFAGGLHEEFLNQLLKLGNLNVIPRASVLQYVGSTRSITEIAAELRVEAVLTCSVSYADDRVAIRARLLDGVSGFLLWGETYNRDFRDVFGIQADIAMNVANALHAEFSAAEQAEIEQRPTSEPAAYALYLQARQDVNLDREASHDLLDRAIEIDPAFGAAYGLKAWFYATALGNNTLGSGVSAEDRAALIARVREYAARARAIDPGDPDARMALGSINITTWRWSEYRAALEREDFDSLEAQRLWVFSWMRDHDEAIRHGRRLVEIHPNLAGYRLYYGIVLAYAGQREASDRMLRTALDAAPGLALAHHWLALNAIARRDDERGLEQLRIVEQLLGDDRLTVFLPELAYAYSMLGRDNDVERIVTELEGRGDEDVVGLGTWAMAHLAQGEEARALELLERAADKAQNHEVDLGLLQLMNLRMNALDDPRLEQPPFATVLDRIHGD